MGYGGLRSGELRGSGAFQDGWGPCGRVPGCAVRCCVCGVHDTLDSAACTEQSSPSRLAQDTRVELEG